MREIHRIAEADRPVFLSSPRVKPIFIALGVLCAANACARTIPVPQENTPSQAPRTAKATDASAFSAASTSFGDGAADADGATALAIQTPRWEPRSAKTIDGPHEEMSLDAGRPIYWAMPKVTPPRPLRLLGTLHGMCGGPPYACGKWIGAGTDVGAMVCPTGNARCGESPYSPPSWEATTWLELVALMDHDLETSIARVQAKHRGDITREGAILTGYSRGGFAAPQIARMHPQRWPYLIIIEANAPLTVASLKASGVRAVALVAGEYGTELVGEQKTQADLEAAGFPAKLFVMRKTSHPYSEDMEFVMHDALTFLLEEDARSPSLSSAVTDAGK